MGLLPNREQIPVLINHIYNYPVSTLSVIERRVDKTRWLTHDLMF